MASLSAGARLGTYEIVEPLGAGGMGEVYRARDTELGRDVAIKVLPEDFSEDEERLARFRREAQVLASLNHPNIAAIYGTESPQPERSAERSGVAEREAVPPSAASQPSVGLARPEDGRSAKKLGPRGTNRSINALILELVEGPTLAERISRGAISLDEAIPIARQIAEALEAAHEAGVIHRDLKPANVKVQEDGTVKVLDFGLAKAVEGEADGNASESPTMTAAATRAGVILGTAAYMSPEQAKGKRVDKRADVWAFGAVLYEMLTGNRPFVGEDISDTLAAVLRAEPDWDALPADVPTTLRSFLARCLEKDPRARVRDIGDVRLAMTGAFETGTQPSAQGVEQRFAWPAVAVGLLIGSLVTGAAVWSLRPDAPRPLARFIVDPSIGSPYQGDLDLAMTPDGSRIVYLTGEHDLVVRAFDDLDGTPFGGLPPFVRGPFVSPDGEWVGFLDAYGVHKVSILGGPPETICEFDAAGSRGASWGDDGTIIFATAASSGLWRVSADGGEPEESTMPGAGQEDHLWPEILPGSRAVLFNIVGESLDNAQVAVLSLDTGKTKILFPGGTNPRYAPSGHIVYGAEGALRAIRFDLDTLEVRGGPVPVVDGVRIKRSGAVDFRISQNGSLAYVSGPEEYFSPDRVLVWVDREGNEEAIAAEPHAYRFPRLSPDGTQLAIGDQENSDLWVWSFGRERLTRLTFDPAWDLLPVWTPDGARIAFGSLRRRDTFSIELKAADGTGAVDSLVDDGLPLAFSPDGHHLLLNRNSPETGEDIYVRSMDAEGTIEPLLVTEFNENYADISPDGHWLAYQSDAAGRNEIYVRPFPNVNEGRWQISDDGGTTPQWGPDGLELFYRAANRQVTSVSVNVDGDFNYGNPEVVFEEPYHARETIVDGRTFHISPDGKRFLMMKQIAPSAERVPTQVILVQNWLDELKRLVPREN